MLRNATVVAGFSVLATVLVSASTAVAAPAPQLDVYAGDVPRAALTKLVALGIDRHEIDLSAARAAGKGAVHVETILSGEQAQQLAKEGVDADAEGDRRPDRHPARDGPGSPRG